MLCPVCFLGFLIPYMSRRFAKFMPATMAYALYRIGQAGPAGFGGKTARQLAIYKDDVTVPLAQRDVGNPHGGAQLRRVL